MSRKFNRWLRSKTGLVTLGCALVVVLILALVGVQQGWIGGPGAAIAIPSPAFPAPAGGYTCLPTCNDGVALAGGQPSPQDGKFIALPGSDLLTFSPGPQIFWIGVPAQYTELKLDIFDGDSGLDGSGNPNPQAGHWDNLTAETVYTLYADPLENGAAAVRLGEWRGNALKMPDNDWYSLSIPIDPGDPKIAAAQAPSGHYFFRLEAALENPGPGLNAFKLRSNSYLSTGQSDSPLAETLKAQVALVGRQATLQDYQLLQTAKSTYTGNWYFYFPVDHTQDALQIWDGDFDRGTSDKRDADTDDPNTAGKPAWAGPGVLDEGVNGYPAGQGAPPDDNATSLLMRLPAVTYKITDPTGQQTYSNVNASGTSEWENFTITSNPAAHPDADANAPASFQPGLYTLNIHGLDLNNVIWLRLPLCDPVAGCGPRTTEGTCPRAIGYWTDNAKSVLIDGGAAGAQETKASFGQALAAIANWSPLFRTGLDVNHPQPLPAGTPPLNEAEAAAILLRGASMAQYPGDPSTMIANTLQQNLAAWLNLTSGKVGANASVRLSQDGNTVFFEGTLWDALQEAQRIILEPSSTNEQMQRARDIANLINNALLGEQAASSACSDYANLIPPDRSPSRDQMARQPNPASEPLVDLPAPDLSACPVDNAYEIQNPTTDPFYSLKFIAGAGAAVNNGGSVIFQYSLPKSAVQSMQSIQAQVRVAQNYEIVTLTCNFAAVTPCDGTGSALGAFMLQYLGAQDSGENFVLSFQATVFDVHALSDIAFQLPDGQSAIDPKASCPAAP